MKRPRIALDDSSQAAIIDGIAWPYEVLAAANVPEGSTVKLTRANNCVGFDGWRFKKAKKLGKEGQNVHPVDTDTEGGDDGN